MAVKCPKCHSENPETKQFCADCGTRLIPFAKDIYAGITETLQTPVKELTTGTTFAGRYQVIEELGHGGMGRVYKVFDTDIKEKIALKLLRPEVAQDRETIERFSNELKLARKISHRNVCRMFDLGKAEDTIFITMEFVPGEDLKSMIHMSGSLSVGMLLSVGKQVCDGLAEAHSLGVIHRDLKPRNIMIDKDGHAKIMDFGIARSVSVKGITGAGVMIGTPEYMSPEQAEAGDVDHRSDIYSLGVILYEMATSHVPFEGDTALSIAMKQKGEIPKNPKQLNSNIPDDLSLLILRCLEKDRTKRYQTAAEVYAELDKIEKGMTTTDRVVPERRIPTSKSKIVRIRYRKYLIAAVGLIVLVLGFLAVKLLNHQSKVRWARQKALPAIMELVKKENYLEAFKEAKQAEKIIPQDSTLAKLWPEMSTEVTVETDPAGADVFLKDYRAADKDWNYLGKSPLEKVRIPLGFFRWKIEKQGYRVVERASGPPEEPWRLTLDQEASLPAGMVRVRGGRTWIEEAVLGDIPWVKPEDFLIDKYEVTNRQFKEFVDRGGYQERTYWKYPFRMDGKTLSWEEAMARFRDATGRPGPATWELGTYPEGQVDFPVSGISWYEAAAYAESVAKSLPTIFHWVQAADIGAAPYIIPLSNFGGKGPARVGSFGGLSFSGNYDMAGNVREWCFNESRGLRYLMGGAWDSPPYMFSAAFALSPADRSASNGFRCIKSLSGAVSDKAMKPIPIPYSRDFYKEKPVSDGVFNIYRRQFAYDKGELNSVIEYTDESSEYWKKEKISFNAAYGNERVTAYLFLPKKGAPPYQTIIFFPGADALDLRSSEGQRMENIDFIIKSGRAVLYPVYKSTYERGDGFGLGDPLNSLRDHIVFWVKDLARSIDYLETRVDINSRKIGYSGDSLGGVCGVFLLPWEKRIKACVLLNGGFVPMQEWATVPEIDFINLAPRLTIPTLMLNGRYDFIFPVETSQKPMFYFLGTPKEQKRYVLYDTAHDVPRNEMIKETLNWFDRYLGPVR